MVVAQGALNTCILNLGFLYWRPKTTAVLFHQSKAETFVQMITKLADTSLYMQSFKTILFDQILTEKSPKLANNFKKYIYAQKSHTDVLLKIDLCCVETILILSNYIS